jgi:hypothetical protein
VLFGGADVKFKRSLKERMLELADRLKARLQGNER